MYSKISRFEYELEHIGTAANLKFFTGIESVRLRGEIYPKFM